MDWNCLLGGIGVGVVAGVAIGGLIAASAITCPEPKQGLYIPREYIEHGAPRINETDEAYWIEFGDWPKFGKLLKVKGAPNDK